MIAITLIDIFGIFQVVPLSTSGTIVRRLKINNIFSSRFQVFWLLSVIMIYKTPLYNFEVYEAGSLTTSGGSNADIVISITLLYIFSISEADQLSTSAELNTKWWARKIIFWSEEFWLFSWGYDICNCLSSLNFMERIRSVRRTELTVECWAGNIICCVYR